MGSSGPVLQITEIVIHRWSLWRRFIVTESPPFERTLDEAPGLLNQNFYSQNKPPPRFVPTWLQWIASFWLGFLGLPVSKPWHHISVVWWQDRESVSGWATDPASVRMRDWLNANTPEGVSYWTAEVDAPQGPTIGKDVGPPG
jgi:hypothetical protein